MIGWSGICTLYRVIHIKGPAPAKVKEPKRRVAPLLHFRNNQPRAQGVNGTRGNKDNITARNRAPLNQISNRTINNGVPKLLRRQASR